MFTNAYCVLWLGYLQSVKIRLIWTNHWKVGNVWMKIFQWYMALYHLTVYWINHRPIGLLYVYLIGGYLTVPPFLRSTSRCAQYMFVWGSGLLWLTDGSTSLLHVKKILYCFCTGGEYPYANLIKFVSVQILRTIYFLFHTSKWIGAWDKDWIFNTQALIINVIPHILYSKNGLCKHLVKGTSTVLSFSFGSLSLSQHPWRKSVCENWEQSLYVLC